MIQNGKRRTSPKCGRDVCAATEKKRGVGPAIFPEEGHIGRWRGNSVEERNPAAVFYIQYFMLEFNCHARKEGETKSKYRKNTPIKAFTP